MVYYSFFGISDIKDFYNRFLAMNVNKRILKKNSRKVESQKPELGLNLSMIYAVVCQYSFCACVCKYQV